MGLLRKWFGPSQKEIWSQLAEQIGGKFLDGGMFKPNKVIAHVGEWTVTLDTFTVSHGNSSSTYTRMRAPYVNADGFRFTIYRKSIFSGMGKALGMQDIEVGHRDFDDAFIVKGTHPSRLRDLLANDQLRELMMEQPSIHISVKDDEGWFGADFPDGVDELYFYVGGVVKDVPRLEAMFDLFGEALDTLCELGSAYEEDPGVNLG